MGGLKGVFALLSLLNSLLEIFQKWRLKKEVQAEVNEAVAKKEADALNKATAVVAEPRSDDDTARRLQDGKF